MPNPVNRTLLAPTRRAPPERAKPLPPELISVIGSILCDTGDTVCIYYACQTESGRTVSNEPLSKLAPTQLASIHGTRCDACGDVRPYQLLKDGTTDAGIRAELDEFAGFLTEACSEAISHERH